MNKQHILDEIKRTAAENGGVPLGHRAFFRNTGIKEAEWGRYWIRWGEATREAGFDANALTAAYSAEFLIEKLIELARERAHFPVTREIKMKARQDSTFPWDKSFDETLGSKPARAAKVLQYCQARTGYDDIIALCEPLVAKQLSEPVDRPADDTASGVKAGYVYMALLKLGREKRYKIGKAVLVERRTDQISIQLPKDLELIHAISTDDAYGIEAYWHRRFAEKNTNGEWFSLNSEDISAFKRRKFM